MNNSNNRQLGIWEFATIALIVLTVRDIVARIIAKEKEKK